MTDPHFPYWWVKYDYFHPTDLDAEAEVEVEGLTMTARGFSPAPPDKNPLMVRWDWSDGTVEAYVLDGNWKDSLPYKRFGWAVGYTKKGIEAVPRYAGHWYAAGEAATVESAVKSMQGAIGRARRLAG